jgi:hypothetical protein
LLSGTGVQPTFTGTNAVALKAASSLIKTAAEAKSQTLPKVTVEAENEYDPEYYADPHNKDYVIPNATRHQDRHADHGNAIEYSGDFQAGVEGSAGH